MIQIDERNLFKFLGIMGDKANEGYKKFRVQMAQENGQLEICVDFINPKSGAWEMMKIFLPLKSELN